METKLKTRLYDHLVDCGWNINYRVLFLKYKAILIYIINFKLKKEKIAALGGNEDFYP